MTTASQAIRLALERFAGIHGAMATAIERGRPVKREALQGWILRLRAAADELERALK